MTVATLRIEILPIDQFPKTTPTVTRVSRRNSFACGNELAADYQHAVVFAAEAFFDND